VKFHVIWACIALVPAMLAQTYDINVATTAPSGDKIRGPVTVHVTGVNGLRQRSVLATTITYPAGPSLSGIPFIPPIPSSQEQSNVAPNPQQPANPSVKPGGAPGHIGPAAIAVTPPDIGGIFSDYVDQLKVLEKQRFDLQNKIQNVINQVNAAKGQADALVATSDAALVPDPTGASLIARAQAVHTSIQPAIVLQWPDSDVATLSSLLAVLKDNLNTMPTFPGWAAWTTANAENRPAYDGAVARVTELQTLAGAMDGSTNSSAATMRSAQASLLQWDDVLQALGPGSFSYTLQTTCSLAFGDSKETKVVLSSVDRFAPAGTAAATQEIVTAVCSSPISISGGFAFSTIKEQDIDLISSSKTVKDGSGNSTTQNISIFGYKALSSFHPLPLLLVNVRFWEPNETISLHFSGGAAVDIKTGATAGASVEYLAGISLGFFRSFFLTTAFHAGRVPTLAGGFSIGQEVPTGISSAPVENRWKPGFAIALSYKLR
jgi:hypothetical protein